MIDLDITECKRYYEALKSGRLNWDSHFSEVERRLKPAMKGFNTKTTEGQRKREYIFDSTTALALNKSANILTSFAVPERSFYHNLVAQDEELNQDVTTNQYLSDENKKLFRLRYASGTGFTSSVTEFFNDLMAYGNGVLYSQERVGRGMKYKSCDFASTWFVKGSDGLELIAHEQDMTAKGIMDRFPDATDEKLLLEAKRNPNKTFDVVHLVLEGKDKVKGFKYQGYFFSCALGKILNKGGYYTMPYQVGTANKWAGENYGRGAAMIVLPDIKMINQMTREYINGVQMAFQPPMLLSDDGALSGFNMVPGALNYGMLDDSGRKRVEALNVGADPRIAEYGIDRARQTINDAFYINLFQVLVETPSMTATEVLERTRERGYLIGPIISEFNDDIMSPLVERELDTYQRAGQIGDAPEQLMQKGGRIKIEYSSEVLRAQELGDVVNFTKMLQSVAPLLELNPKLLEQEIDSSKAFRKIAKAFGQIDVFRTEDEAKEMMAAQEQQAQQSQLLSALPDIANSANSIAQAQATVQGI